MILFRLYSTNSIYSLLTERVPVSLPVDDVSMLLSLCCTIVWQVYTPASPVLTLDIVYFTVKTRLDLDGVFILPPDGLNVVLANERPFRSLLSTKLDTVIVHVKVAVFPAITDIELSDTTGTGTKGRSWIP